ncbi:MAG: ABC transporter substrate-binding protein [Proteobacteria bacterium]|nr:ABC transporter substrate-binding protein [Pseudomonadota bacterium]
MQITRRTALAASLAALAAPALVRTAAAQGQPFTLLLDWFINPDHGPIMAAQELGYFREAGLDIRIIPPADPNDPPRLVAAGRGDVAVSYPHLQIRQAVDDIPTMRIGALIDTPLSTLTVLADGPIKTLADFRGRKIGYSISGIENAVLRAMLGTVGVGLNEVELVNVNFSLSPALLAKRVDGVIGAFRNFELFQLEIEGSKGRAFFLEEHGVPTHDALTFAANREKARAGDPRLRKFLDAVERGSLYCTNNPEEAWKLFIKGRSQLDNELNRRAWTATVPRFAHSPGAVDKARELRFAEFLHANGIIPHVPPADSFIAQLA